MSRWELIKKALEDEAASLPHPDFSDSPLSASETAIQALMASIRQRWISAPPPLPSGSPDQEQGAFLSWFREECDDAVFSRMIGSVAVTLESIILDAGRGVEGEVRIEGADEPYLEVIVNQAASPLLSGGGTNPVRIQSVAVAQRIAASVGIPQAWGVVFWRWIVNELRQAPAPGLLPGIDIAHTREDFSTLIARINL